MYQPAASPVGTTLITGFLGVGKTTAIRHLLAHKPAAERWAVLVNEFGEIGIDGATLAGEDGVAIREVAGGCICCTSGPMLRVALTRLLRERPDRLLIEPTGLGHPAGIIDSLREPGLAKALQLNAVITLVDPAQFLDPRYRQHPVYADQITLADILVANKCDRADAATLAQFQQAAAGLYPPKQLLANIEHGRLDPAWLDWQPRQQRAASYPDAHRGNQPQTAEAPLLAPDAANPPLRRTAQGLDSSSCGWLFSADFQFSLRGLKHWAEALAGFAAGQGIALQRAKGVFRCGERWWWLNWTPAEHDWQAIAWRRDSRCELIADATTADWLTFEHGLLQQLTHDPRSDQA